MSADYPLLLDLAGRQVVVVGGGTVAARRVAALVAAGAQVHVVAPQVTAEIAALSITVSRRRYRPDDLDGAWLVHACTDDAAVNATVAEHAAGRRVFCVRADDATLSAAHTPAVARAGGVTVAVGAGGDPRTAAAIRDAVRLLLETGQLPVRDHRRPAGRTGSVALVGGGPGDPGLITVRGRTLLAAADVVVVDSLAPRALLAALPPQVEVVEAAKSPGCHTLAQEEINGIIVARARAGLRVVRLKGGDPFLFGRGGEELRACVAAGVRCEVVPGVTSALGVPAVAGIPVTHRGLTQQVTVVSGHLPPGHPQSTVDWRSLGAGTGTVVLLMAMSQLGKIAAVLVEHGRPGDTPVAVVQRGTTDQQRTLVSTLDRVSADVHLGGLGSPAVVVVGDVVGLRESGARP